MYGGASAINKAFSLVTFPLLAHHFSVSEYGLIDLFMIFTSFLAIMLVFGQDSAVARYFYEYRDEKSRKELISESLGIQVLLLLFFIPPLWLSAEYVSNLISDSEQSETLLKLNILQLPFIVLQNFSRNLLKWTFSRKFFLIISIGSVFFYMILLLVGVCLLKINITGVFVVMFISNSLFGLLGLYFVRSWLIWPNKFVFSRELLQFAAPYGLICCVGSFIPTMERSLVANLLGTHELGLYSAASKVAMLIGIIVQSFQTAWGPFSLAIYKNDDAIDTYNWVLKVYTLLVCLAAFLLSVIAEPILIILASNKYEGAGVIVFPLTIGIAVQSISWITEIGISISKKSHLSLYSYFVFITVSGVSIYFLSFDFGLFGVAIGMMLGYVSNGLIASFLSYKACPLSWNYRPIIFFVLSTVIFGFIVPVIDNGRSFMITFSIALLSSLILGLIGWYTIFTMQERSKIYFNIRSNINAKFGV